MGVFIQGPRESFMNSMKYRIYVDEVGNSDLEGSEDPNHRFLSLTGAILGLDYVENVLHPQMEALKSEFFPSHHPDEPVVLHRKEMVNRRGAFRILEDPIIRKNFDGRLLALLTTWDYAVISVCLDKKRHKETYQIWRYDPYHYCLAVLLERVIFFLEQNSSQGDVMAESRGGKEDMRLKESFLRLWHKGTEYVAPERLQKTLMSKQLKVKPKTNNISGLQLADLIAHSSRNEILKDQGFPFFKIRPFAEEVITILQEKYYQRGGQIFGKKFL
jgi:hypothetical protein